MQQCLLSPELGSGARLEGDHFAVRGRDVEHVFAEDEPAVARGLVRPPDLAGVERQHGDPSLKANGVHVLPGHADGRIDVGETLELGAAVRRRDSRLPLHRAVSHVGREHLAVVEAAQHQIAGDHRACRAAQRQARDLLLLGPQLVAVGGAQGMELAVDGAHGDQPLGNGRRRQHLAVEAHLPAHRAVGGIEGKQLAIARAHQDLRSARRGATGERRARVRAPQHAARGEIEGHEVAAVTGRVQAIVRDRQPEPEPQHRGFLVVDAGAPDALHPQLRGERGQLRRLIDALVLGAGRDGEQRRQRPGQRQGLQVSHEAYLPAPDAVDFAVVDAACAGAGAAVSAVRSAILSARSESPAAPACALRYSFRAAARSPLA